MKGFFSALRAFLLVLCIGGICVSCWKLWEIYHTYQEGQELYQNLTALVVAEVNPAAETTAEYSTILPEPEAEGEIPQVALGISVDFDALRSINPEAVGWIYCPDTAINYPVVQGSDNDYYLRHLLDGTSNRNGTIFADANNSSGFADQNTILYGHHMKNGAMFASLEGYREQAYFDQHPVLYLLTPEGDYQLQVFSACVTSASDEVYTLQFGDAEDYRLWLNRQAARSDIESSVSVAETDRVITLSTCAYDFDDARYVVLAKLVPVNVRG